MSFVICHWSFADEYLRDVPEGHWAKDAVYELVRSGVTGGYPDGTYRGSKNITRYEIASFMSKLARSFKLRRGSDEKLVEELKSEIALFRYQQEKEARETKFTGELCSRARHVTNHGERVDYRLKFSLLKEFDPGVSARINLDTMDCGFSASSDRPLAGKLLDLEGRFRLGAYDFKFVSGPGTVPHTEPDNFSPSENYMIFIRPKSALEVSTRIGKMDLCAGYVTRAVAASGLVGVHEITARGSYDFGMIAVSLRPRCLFKIDGPRDILADLGVDFKPSKYWETGLFLSAGSFRDANKGLYAKLIQSFKELGGATDITLRFDKVGSEYRVDNLDKYEFIYLNNFDRLILDGTADLGAKIRQKLSDRFALEWVGDCVTTGDFKYGEDYPGTYFLWQLGLQLKLRENITGSAFYRAYSVPSGIAQFSDSVPKFSELVGIKLQCAF